MINDIKEINMVVVFLHLLLSHAIERVISLRDYLTVVLPNTNATSAWLRPENSR